MLRRRRRKLRSFRLASLHRHVLTAGACGSEMRADIRPTQKPNESVARGLRRLFSPVGRSVCRYVTSGGNFTPAERTKLTIDVGGGKRHARVDRTWTTEVSTHLTSLSSEFKRRTINETQLERTAIRHCFWHSMSCSLFPNCTVRDMVTRYGMEWSRLSIYRTYVIVNWFNVIKINRVR